MVKKEKTKTKCRQMEEKRGRGLLKVCKGLQAQAQ
jgi:hypothetical protein